jgi:hypothetical protein
MEERGLSNADGGTVVMLSGKEKTPGLSLKIPSVIVATEGFSSTRITSRFARPRGRDEFGCTEAPMGFTASH